MPRYFVENKGEWNIFSTIVDDFLFDEFICLDALKARLLYEEYKRIDEDVNSLLTDRPKVNVMPYEEAVERIRKDEPQNYCDDCLYTDTCDSKAYFYACTSKATISKMEQVDEPTGYNLSPVDKDINVRSNSSEKPNNCERITEDGVTCAKYPACDDCLDNPLNKVKGSERLVKGTEQTEPTHDLRTETHECVKDTHDKTESTICDFCRYYNDYIPCGSTPSACKEADKFAEEFVNGLKDLRIEADRKTEPSNSEKPNNYEPKTCDNCKLKGSTKWCDNQVVCRAYQPKTEPQTQRSACDTCQWYNSGIPCGVEPSVCKREVEDEPQRNMAEDIVESFGFKAESYRQAKAKTEPQEKEVEWVYNKRERLWYPYSNGELLFKTENSSEKLNNCEELNAYRECVKSRSFWDSKHCDGCYFDERCPFDEPKDEPQTDCAWK